MTIEQAKKMLKAKLECLTRETSGTDIDCNYRNCDECNLCYEQGNMGEQKETLEMAIKALEQAEWIPVSERLPEEDGQYLITVKYVHIDGWDDIYAEHGEWRDGNWDMFCFGHCGQVETILAWMPLPEPYVAEREEE